MQSFLMSRLLIAHLTVCESSFALMLVRFVFLYHLSLHLLSMCKYINKHKNIKRHIQTNNNLYK